MDDRKVSKLHEEALLRLLDDESPTVESALVEEFRRMEDLGLFMLRRLARSDDAAQSARARYYMEKAYGPNPSEAFTRYIRSLNYDLETGVVMLNKVVAANLDPAQIWPQIEQMATRCRELMAPPCTMIEKCRILNRVIFHENGFRGDYDNYEDPLNCLIDQVLRRKRGIPITLSILYLAVARRCGVELEPVGLPGRFLVGCFMDGEAFYIDPYEKGVIRTQDEVREILASNKVFVETALMGPTPVAEVLCRCCRNLVRAFTLRNNPARARQFSMFVKEFENANKRSAQY